MTDYHLVYRHEGAHLDRPSGLLRRVRDGTGEVVAEDAYHPLTGWSRTDYWLRTARGEPDKYLVRVDEERAQEIVRYFDDLWRGRTE